MATFQNRWRRLVSETGLSPQAGPRGMFHAGVSLGFTAMFPAMFPAMFLAVFLATFTGLLPGCLSQRARRLEARGRDREALSLLDRHYAFFPELRSRALAHLGRWDEAYDMAVLGLARGAGDRRRLTLRAADLAVKTKRTVEAMEWFEQARRLGVAPGPWKKTAGALWTDAAGRFAESSDWVAALDSLAHARGFGVEPPRKILDPVLTRRVEALLRWSRAGRARKETRRWQKRLGLSNEASRGRWQELLAMARRMGDKEPLSSAALDEVCRAGLWALAAKAFDRTLPSLARGCKNGCGRLVACGLEAAWKLGGPGLVQKLGPLLPAGRGQVRKGLVAPLSRLCLGAASLDAPACHILRKTALGAGAGAEPACHAYLQALAIHGGRDRAFAEHLWSRQNLRRSRPCGLLDGSWRWALGSVAQGRSDENGGTRDDRDVPLPLAQAMVALGQAWLAGQDGEVIRLANSLALAHRQEPLVRLALGRTALALGRIDAALAHLHWAEALAQGQVRPLVEAEVRRLERIAFRLREFAAPSKPNQDVREPDEKPASPQSRETSPPQSRRPGSVQSMDNRAATSSVHIVPRGSSSPGPCLPAQVARLLARRDKAGLLALGRRLAGRALAWAGSLACRAEPGSAALWAPRLLAAAGRKREAADLLEAMALRGASVCRWPWVWRAFRGLRLWRRGQRLADRLLGLFPRSGSILLGKVALTHSGLVGVGALAERGFRWWAANRLEATAQLVRARLRAGRCEDAGRVLGFFLERLGRDYRKSREAVRLLAWFRTRCGRRGRRDRILPLDLVGKDGYRLLARAAAEGLEAGGAPAGDLLRVLSHWPSLCFARALHAGSARVAAAQALRWTRIQPLAAEPFCALARVAVRSRRFDSAEALLARARAMEPLTSCVAQVQVELDLARGQWDEAGRGLGAWLRRALSGEDRADLVEVLARFVSGGLDRVSASVMEQACRIDQTGADVLAAALLDRAEVL